jgi:hypothetical protein
VTVTLGIFALLEAALANASGDLLASAPDIRFVDVLAVK